MTKNDSHAATSDAIRVLSDRLVEAQRPIYILDAVRWTAAVREEFFGRGASEQPRVDLDYYRNRPLRFDPETKREELRAIDRDVATRLGYDSAAGHILHRMCREYDAVVRMLERRGTDAFAALSGELYGRAADAFRAGDATLADLGRMFSEALDRIDGSKAIERPAQNINAEEAAKELRERLGQRFERDDVRIDVHLSGEIVSDAAAGSDYLKLRRDAVFDRRAIRLLEIHEGWVHLGTTINGRAQPHCRFLGKGPPSSTITQEGLAVFMEIICFASYPERLRRITNRVEAIRMATDGASFLEVFRRFRDLGLDDEESYSITTRAFRGSTPEGGPFTKDLSYARGFVHVYNYVMSAVRRGLLDRIPLLFCGKTTIEDMKRLAHLRDEGLISAPRFLPPPIRDLGALTSWMCVSSFITGFDPCRLLADYDAIL